MDDPDVNEMRQKILQAVEQCNDLVTLDFVLKMVIRSNELS